MGDALETSTTNEDGTDGIDKVVHRIDISGKISPIGHRSNRSEETRKQHQANYKEPHDEHGLLHGVAIVGDNKSEAAEEECQ